ncbi:MAG: SH3 domain-containing protein, partial [Candidatus Acidiferrum sp.]
MLAHACPAKAQEQAIPYARTFAKPKAEVDQALKDLGAFAGQKLPTVEGFVATPRKPFSRYERAFYQLEIELFPGTGARGGTVVQVRAKITAWYADPDPANSGYEVLASNGRLEFDLLDRLDERLGTAPPQAGRSGQGSDLSAPKAKLDLSGVPGAAQLSTNTNSNAVPRTSELSELRSRREDAEKREQQLSGQLQELQEIQKNQAHPANLVAVKKSGTPVLARPAEGAKVLFLAAAGDEFEYLDSDGAWLHVGISGVSRGYVRRSGVELTDFIISRIAAQDQATATKENAAPFRVEREESSMFPGAWASLKGKTVKIYTVQPISQDAKDTDARAKLSFAAGLFRKFAAGESETPAVDGVVVIYDS